MRISDDIGIKKRMCVRVYGRRMMDEKQSSDMVLAVGICGMFFLFSAFLYNNIFLYFFSIVSFMQLFFAARIFFNVVKEERQTEKRIEASKCKAVRQKNDEAAIDRWHIKHMIYIALLVLSACLPFRKLPDKMYLFNISSSLQVVLGIIIFLMLEGIFFMGRLKQIGGEGKYRKIFLLSRILQLAGIILIAGGLLTAAQFGQLAPNMLLSAWIGFLTIIFMT